MRLPTAYGLLTILAHQRSASNCLGTRELVENCAFGAPSPAAGHLTSRNTAENPSTPTDLLATLWSASNPQVLSQSQHVWHARVDRCGATNSLLALVLLWSVEVAHSRCSGRVTAFIRPCAYLARVWMLCPAINDMDLPLESSFVPPRVLRRRVYWAESSSELQLHGMSGITAFV